MMHAKVRMRSAQDVLGMGHAPHRVRLHHVIQAIIYQVGHASNAMKVIHRLMVILVIVIHAIKIALFLVLHKNVQKMQLVQTGQKLHLAHKSMVETVMPHRNLAQLKLHVTLDIIYQQITNVLNVPREIIVQTMYKQNAHQSIRYLMQGIPAKEVVIKMLH